MSAPDVLLRGREITRRWGGLVAVDKVSIELERGSVHAVIGTNGAGKSTLINILSGEIAPSSGPGRVAGPRRHRLVAAAARARRPRPQLPAQHHLPELHGVRELPPRGAGAHAEALALVAARAALRSQHAPRRAPRRSAPASTTLLDRPAGLLSHGQKRQLEIAMCLATAPEVLLLDEPLAGMGAEETDRMLALLAELKAGHAILLVEHDMDAVFRIADRITVMVNGAVIASDTPEAVRHSPAVQAAYLGGH